ncbi:MAG: nucleotidyltransferase family protein [Clostridia bacterium]|nr:nucleotidyltransferase family protein [Clostridia bacterium]
MIEYYKKYLIQCLNSCLKMCDAPKPEQEVDWKKLYRFSRQNGVETDVYLALKNTDYLPPEEREKFAAAYQTALEKQEAENEELEKLLGDFRDGNIPYMLMKGIITRKMYPQEIMRSAADIDIYYQSGYTDRVREIFFDNGYNLAFSGISSDFYKKVPYLEVEMHKQLLSPLTKIGKVFKYNPFLHGITGDGLEYSMNSEDYYLFHFCHLAQHFYESGAGIKFFMDIKVLRDILELDEEYVYLKLKKYKLTQFHDESVKLANYWFSGAQADETTQTYEEYVLDYGAYGSGVIFDFNRTNFGKRNKYVSAIFPNAERLAIHYPDVKENKYKVPYYWIKRAVDYKGTIRERLKTVGSYHHTDFDKIKDFYDKIGL